MTRRRHIGKSSRRLGPFSSSLIRNRLAAAGLGLVVVLSLISLLAPFLAPYDPLQQNYLRLRQAVSKDHWLGCDQLGRDILSRLLHGGRITMTIGLVSVSIGLLVGTILGLTGGYYGGMIDGVLVYLTDLLLTFPGILLALAVIAALGPGIPSVIAACGFSSIPQFIRLTRGVVLAEKEKDYITAARAIGENGLSIMLRYLLPNCLASVVVFFSLHLAVVILIAAGLSFLGFGAQPPSPEWGAMLSEGRHYLMTAPHIAIFPGLAIMIAVLAFNLLGDGLRDALDPRMKI
ncbi:MAG: ABC transporter permease [Thermodesulfobacteriota bacterium]